MSIISDELEQVRQATGFGNKLLLLVITGRATAMIGMGIALLTVIGLIIALYKYPAQAADIVGALGVLGCIMGGGSHITSIAHTWLGKLPSQSGGQP